LGVVLFFFAVIAVSNVAASTSKKILVEAISTSESLSNNLTVETRLKRYEKIASLVDKIISDHADSDEAIALVSGEKIGNFDYRDIKKRHFEEMKNYFGTVCKVAPSFQCIALVSLDRGSSACQNAMTLDALITAQNNIKNSLIILQSQNADQTQINLARNEYRSCAKSSGVRLTSADKDFLASQLIDVYLELGEIDQARATIQSIKSPYPKFAGVLSLQRNQGKVDRAYIQRMKEFVRTTMPREYASLAYARLQLEILSQTKFPLTKDNLEFSVTGDDLGSLLIAIELVDAAIEGLKRPELRSLGNWSTKKKSRYIGGHTSAPFSTIVDIYKAVALVDHSDAKKFLMAVALKNYEKSAAYEYLFDLQQSNPAYDTRFFNNMFNPLYRVKALARKGELCRAVEIIFNDFQGGPNYPLAIEFLIGSPSIDRKRKYDCGDAELEMLLGVS
tara:strand:- start:738 stop:2081 length:1344 start_codon:yes stop_codon:yes gene_type:complete